MLNKWTYTLGALALLVLAFVIDLAMADARLAYWIYAILAVLVVAGVVLDLSRQKKIDLPDRMDGGRV